MLSESMRDTPELAKLLRRRGEIRGVAPVERLGPQRARTQSVAMPTDLPQGLPYGNVTPGIPHGSRFTGAVAQAQPMSQMMPPPDFVAPPSHPGMIGGPGPSPTMGGGTLMPPGGGTFSPSPMPHPPSSAPMPPGGGTAMPTGGGFFGSGHGQYGNPAGAPGSSGGYRTPPPPVQAAMLANFANAANNPPTFQPYTGLAALLANPAVGRRGVYNV